MAEVDTSVYNRPPPPNPLDAITKIGQANDSLGGLAVGQAMQGALGPDGSIDQNALASILRQSPVGARQAIPTLDALQKLKSAGFAADQAGLETFQKRMAITHHLFSGLASRDNPTIDDVHDVAAKALDPALEAHKYGITMPVIMNAIKQFRGPDGKPLSSAQIKQKALEIQTQAASTSEILDAHHPRHEVVDRGGNLEIVPTGSKLNPAIGTVVPKNLPPSTLEYPAAGGAPRYRGEQPAPPPAAVGPGGIPYVPPLRPGRPGRPQQPPAQPLAGNPPGFQEAQSGIATQSAASANALTRAADEAPNTKALLGNLEDDLEHFVSGPGADWTKFAKAAANRNLPIPESWKKEGAVFDEKSVASQEKFVKTAELIAQAGFKAMGGTGTNDMLASNSKTSPNDALSKLGNKGIIYYLKGAADAPVAKNDAWLNWLDKGSPERPNVPHGPESFAQFAQYFNKHFDPRVFMFKYIPEKERQSYVNQMKPAEFQEFSQKLHVAERNGWINFNPPEQRAAPTQPAAPRQPAGPSGAYNPKTFTNDF